MSSSEKVIVTIRGSVTPSVALPRGAERTVLLTPKVQRLIDRGYVTVTKREVIAPLPPAPPAYSASRQAWADFLNGLGYAVPDTATRAELIDLWETSA